MVNIGTRQKPVFKQKKAKKKKDTETRQSTLKSLGFQFPRGKISVQFPRGKISVTKNKEERQTKLIDTGNSEDDD